MKERMYAMSNIDLEKLACLRMAGRAVELATAKINMVGAEIMSLGDSLPTEQQEAFKEVWKRLEGEKRKSSAGLVGYLRHEEIITSEMISATGRVNIGEANGDPRMQYVEGYQYSPRTIKRWEKTKMMSEVVPVVDPVRKVIEAKLAECVPSDKVKYLTRDQKLLRTIKRTLRDEIEYPVSGAVEKVERLFSGKRKDGTKIHRHSLLKRVKGYLEPSLGALDRVILGEREDGTRIHQRPLWQIIKDSFFEKKEDLFGRILAKREENKRYHQMDMERQTS